LKDEQKQQIIALGRRDGLCERSKRPSECVEKPSAPICEARAEIWPPGRWKREGKAKPAIQVITGSEAAKPAIPESGGQLNFKLNPEPENLSATGKAKATSKPAIAVITDFGIGLSGQGARKLERHGAARQRVVPLANACGNAVTDGHAAWVPRAVRDRERSSRCHSLGQVAVQAVTFVRFVPD
jgi:hypothetical protein